MQKPVYMYLFARLFSLFPKWDQCVKRRHHQHRNPKFPTAHYRHVVLMSVFDQWFPRSTRNQNHISNTKYETGCSRLAPLAQAKAYFFRWVASWGCMLTSFLTYGCSLMITLFGRRNSQRRVGREGEKLLTIIRPCLLACDGCNFCAFYNLAITFSRFFIMHFFFVLLLACLLLGTSY